MDKELPLITVIINTKNHTRSISRCIEGIQNQTYQNYEHIVVDSGTDNTKKIVGSCNDPCVIHISTPKDGSAAQAKEAFKLSKDEFITFLDDDDKYTPEKLEKQLDLIQSLSDDYGFIYGAMTYYDNSTKERLNIHGVEIGEGPEISPIVISKPAIYGTPTFVFHCKALEPIGDTRISGIGNDMSDWALGCRALKQGWKVTVLKKSYLRICVNHQATHMSDASFYKDNSQRYIRFRNHLLSEYADIIVKNPKVGIFHYGNLVHFYVAAGRAGDAFKTWYKLIKARPNFHSLVSFSCYFFR